jgi:hypothetical protein
MATILLLAEQHHCGGMKKACFHFLSSLVLLMVVIRTADYIHLVRSCPTVARELILIQHNDLAIANLKFLLICFELLSGLKINYHKSEIIVMGVSPEEEAVVALLMNHKEGTFLSGTLVFQ